MKPFFYLLSLTFNGIKNVEKDVTLDFYKKNIDKEFNSKGYNIKAIYGENGSGKTAVVTAISLLKKLLIEEDYLNSLETQKYLNEIINKNTRKFSCTCELLELVTGNSNVYKYSICLEKSATDKYVITHECLGVRSRTGKEFANRFECNNGEITTLVGDKESGDLIKSKLANLVTTNTFVVQAFINKSLLKDKLLVAAINTMLFFGLEINLYLDAKDQHDLYFLSKGIKELQDDEMVGKLLGNLIANIDRFTGVRNYSVSKELYAEYEKKVKKLEAFLKLFKPELKSISIERKENREYYECTLILNYDNYSIDREFESTGIKKLIDIFDYLNYAAEGRIVFIDEMDANINDVYLCKLVEYFMEYGEGQLCFTTHNVSPMNILRRNKKSIDFISKDNRIIPWRTNGNYSPESLYQAGMIPYLPFNVESTDFLGVLGGADE